MRRLAFLPTVLAALLFFTGGAAAGEEASEPPEDLTVDFNWDGERLFFDLEAGDARVKFDSGAGEYEVYIPRDPESEDPYFRENELRVVLNETQDRITITAVGNKEAIRERFEEVFDGGEGEVDGVSVKELENGYEITVEDRRR